MPLNIKDEETHEMAKRLAARRGVTITRAVKDALGEALDEREREVAARIKLLNEIVERTSRLPVFDDRSPEEILGYDDETGLPR